RLAVPLSQPSPAAETASVAAAPASEMIPASRPKPNLNPHQVDRAQAEQQARSKICWGDAPEEVTKFLRMQGVSIEEASSLVDSLFRERVATLRGIGIRKIVTGILLMCVPVVAFLIFTHMGVLPLKLFAITIMVGLWGGWMFLKGMFMLLAPKSEP